MTTIDYETDAPDRTWPRLALPFRLKRLLARLRRHRRATRTYMTLAQLDDRLLYDIGLEPLDLHQALKQRLPPPMLLDAMRRQFDDDQRMKLR